MLSGNGVGLSGSNLLKQDRHRDRVIVRMDRLNRFISFKHHAIALRRSPIYRQSGSILPAMLGEVLRKLELARYKQ